VNWLTTEQLAAELAEAIAVMEDFLDLARRAARQSPSALNVRRLVLYRDQYNSMLEAYKNLTKGG